MADPDITPCLCGAEALTVAPSVYRTKSREDMQAHVDELTRANLNSGEAQREMGRTQLALQVLQTERYAVSCGNCGRWVHDDSADHAVNLWNRAIAKLDHLQPCCRESSERRMDYDGMVLCVCTSADHDTTINGPRWLPLEPAEDYAPKPSDAGAKA